ncbi:hypothetical protein AX15_002056 [Amanita polypyramis BW_CC]|nr:hypothetical protein AX15_002056 [Amanita polypyramis BW_CC]
MGDAGISLHDRETKRKSGNMIDGEISVSCEEREAFKYALSEIHKAGVRHYDIHPTNLLVDSEGKPTVTDFDTAKMGAGKHSQEREFEDLCFLPKGSYVEPNQHPSPATTQSSHPGSDNLRNL